MTREIIGLQRAVNDLSVMETPNFDIRARVYNSANISIPNSTVTALTFNSERWDTGATGMHSTATNTNRLTAQLSGLYHIFGHVSFATNAIGIRVVYIRVNGTTNIAIQSNTALSSDSRFSIGTDYYLSVGHYVELLVYQDSGGALNVLSAGNYSPEFGMTKTP